MACLLFFICCSAGVLWSSTTPSCPRCRLRLSSSLLSEACCTPAASPSMFGEVCGSKMRFCTPSCLLPRPATGCDHAHGRFGAQLNIIQRGARRALADVVVLFLLVL